MPEKKLKVLYVAGSGRSGSTIIGRILGQVDGCFFAGELCKIWEYGLIQNRSCGCGAPFRRCGFWQEVFRKAYGGIEAVNGRELHELRRKSSSMRHLPMLFVPGGEAFMSRRMSRFSSHLERLYRAIQEGSGSDVIIDCSKSASYGYLLGSMDSIDLHVLHLIRDPRGVAHEKLQRRLYQPEDGRTVYSGRYGLFESSVTWLIQNLAAEAIWKRSPGRYVKLHYEDFVVRPKEAVARIAQMIRKPTSALPFVEDVKVKLDGGSHSAAGNPVRFDSGIVPIRPDTRWREEMIARRKMIVTTLTCPLFIKYGYHRKPKELVPSSGRREKPASLSR